MVAKKRNQNPAIEEKRIVRIGKPKVESVVVVSKNGVVSAAGRAIKIGKFHPTILTVGGSFPDKNTMRAALSEMRL